MRFIACIVSLAFSLPVVSGQAISNEVGFVPAFYRCDSVTVSSELTSGYLGDFANDRTTNQWISAYGLPAWIECSFSEPIAMQSVAFRSSSSTNRTPVDFVVDYWDGSAWQQSLFVTNQPKFASSNETRHYNFLPATSDRWRLTINTTFEDRAGFSELAFSIYHGGSDSDILDNIIKKSAMDFSIQSGGFELVGTWSDDVQVCIDNPTITEICTINQRYSNQGMYLLDHTQVHDINIIASGDFAFSGINVIQQASIATSGGGGASPTATPNPAIVPIQLSNDIDAEYHYIVTAGESHQAQMLIFLILSVWGMALIMLFRSRMK